MVDKSKIGHITKYTQDCLLNVIINQSKLQLKRWEERLGKINGQVLLASYSFFDIDYPFKIKP